MIERLNYAEFLKRYDRPGALFYLDPPYWGSENDYGKNIWSPKEFSHLAALLATLKGDWLLSINDTPEIRRIFSTWPYEELTTMYGIAGGQTDAAELLIAKQAPELLI